MYFPDLATTSQIARGPHVRAVGWLDAVHAFPKGPTSDAFRARLAELSSAWFKSVEALGWPVAGGAHECELCGRFRSGGNFGVPAGELLYVCPEMIAHYVIVHEYLPPEEFVRAVLEVPMPGSTAYAKAVRAFVLEP